jgi:UDP-N-acetylmuramate dehydrogenase
MRLDMKKPALRHLAGLDIGSLRFDQPLSQHCTWRIGGPADLLVEPRSIEHVTTIVRFAREHAISLIVIGQGSNLLFDDAGVRGIVMKIGAELSRIEIDGNTIVAEGGAWVPGLALRAARAGLAGLEHTIGIPGTIGGLVLMNGAGAYGRGIGENVRRVWVVDREGNPAILDAKACRFSYRHSALQEMGAVVVKVELECPTGERLLIRREMLDDLRRRRSKFPRKEPNCGSVFLSSAEMHATVGPPGKIIEEAGLKGVRIGAAEVSTLHANFIVNRGGATSADVLSLISHIRRVVKERIGFELGCEVRYVTPEGDVMPASRFLQGSTRPV